MQDSSPVRPAVAPQAGRCHPRARNVSRRRWWGVTVLGVTAATYVIRLPRTASFIDFAFGDPGSTLKVDTLVAEGYRPGIEFGYPYGLLPVAVGRVWFHVFGRTPTAYLAATAVLSLLLAWALIRL